MRKLGFAEDMFITKKCVFNEKLRCDALDIQVENLVHKPWLGIPIFDSSFWDPLCKQNSNSVFDSKDSGQNFF